MKPDWRRVADYPERISLQRWAWEFLRRNADYQADFAAMGLRRDEEGQDDDGDDAVFQRVHALAVKWGLDVVAPDPADACPRLRWRTSGATVRQVARGSASVTSTTPTIEFDLSRPLAPQFESARRILQSRQKRMIREGLVPRPQVERAWCTKYRTYLRVLDALSERGFPRQEKVPVPDLEFIAEELDARGGVQTANLRKWISAARNLRDGGYRDLPALEGWPGK